MKKQKISGVEWAPRVGDIVNYHSVIGKPPTKLGLKVRAGPELLGGHTWVVWLEGHSGCVCVEAVSPETKQ